MFKSDLNIPSILLFLSINNNSPPGQSKIKKFKKFKDLFQMLLYSENNIIKTLTPENIRVYERFSL
jgi:hypothetical protein